VGAKGARVRSGRVGGLFYGWVVVGAGALALYTVYGIQSSFGIFLPALEADLAPGRRADVSLAFSLYTVLYSLLSGVTGPLTDRWGPRRVVLLGGVALGLGLLLTAGARALWHLYLSYGLLSAVGMSAVFVPISTTVVKWFVARRGTAVGMTLAGNALGQLSLPLLSALLLNLWGWRTAYALYGVGALAVLAGVSRLLHREPEALGLRPYGAPPGGAGSSPEAEPALTLRQAVRTPTLWLYLLTLFLVWTGVFLPVVHLPAFAREGLGLGSALSAFTVTVSAVGSGTGRLGIGAVSDWLGRRRAFFLGIGLQAVGFGLLVGAGLLSSPALAYLGAWVFGLGYGGVASLYPAYTGDLFGRRYVGAVGGFIFSIAGAAAGIGVYFAGAIYQAVGSYTGAFALGALISLTAYLPALWVRPAVARPSHKAGGPVSGPPAGTAS